MEIYEAIHRPDLEILDRVGGGDSFASGLIYGFLTGQNADKAVNYGAAHGALAMTTPGDTTTTVSDVEKVMSGGGAWLKDKAIMKNLFDIRKSNRSNRGNRCSWWRYCKILNNRVRKLFMLEGIRKVDDVLSEASKILDHYFGVTTDVLDEKA